MGVRSRALALACSLLLGAVTACAGPTPRAAAPPAGIEGPTVAPTVAPTTPAAPTTSRRPTPKPSPTRPKPSPTLKKTVTAGADKPTTKPSTSPSDGTPTKGGGTFTVAEGSTDVVGEGTTLVKYRVELEDGISWGSVPKWTPEGFADVVNGVLADPRGWTMSAAHPVTNEAEDMTDASWRFQQVDDSSYSVRIRLATPNTVDKLCGSAGVDTAGVYSCRYGKTIMINLRRWLHGTTGFTNLPFYRAMVINHEVGHFLGFNHMKCPGSGRTAPVMQTQTIALNGCTPNQYPFSSAGTFVVGPWLSS
ncbi:hypothetical protein GCM10009682_30290 [Luedemannella flava]|uniref:DUF3152 domain-containing protein n=1 Tax=Luedemannella flava TaxID=349316 RepID=A0ABN2M1Q0_9ACTN